jgi:hypothetical protein
MTKTIDEPAKAFDSDALDIATAAENPFEFELTNPVTNEGLGVFISVIGSEGDTFQRYLRDESNRARRKSFEAQRNSKPDGPATVEEDEEKILRAIAVCMTGWRTVVDGKSEPTILWSGRKIEFSRENAVAWMRKFRWVRTQINEQTGELRNFIKD